MPRGRVQVSITADTSGLQRGVKDAEGQLGKLDKAGSASAHGVGTAFKAAGGLIAGAAVADQIRETITAAEQAQTVHKQLAAQLKAVGVSYQAHAKDIDGVIKKTSQLSGLSEKDLSRAFTNIVRGSGNVSEGLKGTAIAADLARARHMDVAKAGDLVAKAYEGNVGALKRMGIAIQPVTTAQDKLKESVKHATVEQQRAAKEQDRVATGQKAIAELQKRVGGQAEAYGKSASGAQDRFRVAVENLREAVGAKLLPVITTVATKAADFVNQMTDGTGAGGRFAAKLKDVANAVKPIVKFFTDHPKIVALAVAAWGAYRAAGVAAAAITRGKIIASFLGLAPKAAVGGAEAGVAFGEAEATAANTTMSAGTATGLRGLVGRMPMFGRMLGGALGTAMMYEIAKNFDGPTWQKILRGIMPFQPTPGTPHVTPYAPSKGAKPYHKDPGPLRVNTDPLTHTSPTGTTPLARKPPRQSATGTTPLPKAHGAVAHTSSVHPAAVAHAARAATGGAHSAQPHPADIVAAIEGRADKIDRAHVPYQWGGGHGGRFTGNVIPMDCSGAVSAALGIDPRVSGDFVTWGSPGDGGSHGVTIYANRTHVLMKINGRFWGTSRSNPGGGPGWIDGGVSPGYLSGFTARHMKGVTGAAGAAAPSAPTGADYARHAAHRVAPITSAFGHASGLEGRHVSAAGTAVETYTHQISQAGRIFDRSQEDLNTLPGRIQRVSELSSLQILQKGKLAALRRQVAGKKRQITLKRQEITRLAQAMRRGSRHQRPAIRAKIKKLQGDIKTLKADIRQLGFDVDDAVQDVADTDTEIGTIQAGPQDQPAPLTGTAAIPGADAYGSVLNRDAALAALTPDTADDLDVAKRQQTAAQAILTYEQAHPGQFTPDDVAQAATNLKSANDAITSLTGTGDSQAASDLKAALDANTAELKRQNDFANQVTSVSLGQAWKAIADTISGQITGTGYDPRAMTAGAGALARY